MIGYIFLIIAAIFVYRTAKQNGYNAVLWTCISIAVFIGAQIVVSVITGIILGMISGDLSVNTFETYSFPIGLISLAAGIGSVMLMLRHVNEMPEEKTSTSLLPPSKFDQPE